MRKTLEDAIKHYGAVWPHPDADVIVYCKYTAQYFAFDYRWTGDQDWYEVCTREEFIDATRVNWINPKPDHWSILTLMWSQDLSFPDISERMYNLFSIHVTLEEWQALKQWLDMNYRSTDKLRIVCRQPL